MLVFLTLLFYSVAMRCIRAVWNHSVVILITTFFSRSDLIVGTLQFFWHLSAALCAVYPIFFVIFPEEKTQYVE